MLASEANQSMYDILTGGIGGDMKLILKSGKVPPILKLTIGVISLRSLLTELLCPYYHTFKRKLLKIECTCVWWVSFI